MIKIFFPPKLKYGSSRCFSPGSFAVLSGAAHFRLRSVQAAAFPNFRRGIFSEKCVRTNSRILHQKGKVKELLISKKLFDTCQEVMAKRGKFPHVRKNDFAFLGLMKCASCGCSITAEKQNGHHYYRRTRKKGHCQEKHYLREEALTEQITSYLQKVSLSNQDTEKVLAALDSEQDKAKENAQSEVSVLKEQLSQVE